MPDSFHFLKPPHILLQSFNLLLLLLVFSACAVVPVQWEEVAGRRSGERCLAAPSISKGVTESILCKLRLWSVCVMPDASLPADAAPFELAVSEETVKRHERRDKEWMCFKLPDSASHTVRWAGHNVRRAPSSLTFEVQSGYYDNVALGRANQCSSFSRSNMLRVSLFSLELNQIKGVKSNWVF